MLYCIRLTEKQGHGTAAHGAIKSAAVMVHFVCVGQILSTMALSNPVSVHQTLPIKQLVSFSLLDPCGRLKMSGL